MIGIHLPISVHLRDDLCAESAHDFDLLLGKLLWDKKRDLVSAIYADQSQANTSVSSRGLNDHSARLQFPLFFCSLNDSNRSAVFHTAAGIQVFELGENIGRICRNQSPEPKHGGLADEFSNIVSHTQPRVGNERQSTGYGTELEASMRSNHLAVNLWTQRPSVCDGYV